MPENKTQRADLDAHLRTGAVSAHGIIDMVKAMLEKTIWLAARVDLALTTNATYTDKNVSASVSSRAKSILVNIVENASPGGRWFNLLVRPNGSSADPLAYYAWEIHDSVNGSCHENAWGQLADIPLNYSDKIFEYKLGIDGNWKFYLVGYIEGPAA